MEFTLRIYVDENGNIVYPDFNDKSVFYGKYTMNHFASIKPIPGIAIIADVTPGFANNLDSSVDVIYFNNERNGDNIDESLNNKQLPSINTNYSVVITEFPGHDLPPGNYVDSFQAAIQWCAKVREKGLIYRCIVLGNRKTYKKLMGNELLSRIEMTIVPDATGKEHISLKPLNFRHFTYYRQGNDITFTLDNTEEILYQNLLKKLLSAPIKPNRTGISAHSLFHEVLKFRLSDNRGNILPLLTTKRVFWKSIYHELIWFLRGSTDTKYLVENGVSIWNGNSSREFLDSRGLTEYDVGELGPIYGHQWRNFGKPYKSAGKDCKDGNNHKKNTDDVNGEGKKTMFPDQIADAINILKKDPTNRRIIISAWNPQQLDEMALVPCHYSFQFCVDPCDGKPDVLNCLVNMRSSDTFLGVPFNIASYALLTHMIARIVKMTPGTISLSMADCHLYTNHVDQAHVMVSRRPRQFPLFDFGPNIRAEDNLTIDDFAYKFTFGDYQIIGYNPYPAIKAEMAV